MLEIHITEQRAALISTVLKFWQASIITNEEIQNVAGSDNLKRIEELLRLAYSKDNTVNISPVTEIGGVLIEPKQKPNGDQDKEFIALSRPKRKEDTLNPTYSLQYKNFQINITAEIPIAQKAEWNITVAENLPVKDNKPISRKLTFPSKK